MILLLANLVLLAAGVLVFWHARGMLREAHALRREADVNLQALLVSHEVERDKLLDRIADYDGKPTLAPPERSTFEPEIPADVTRNVESVLDDLEV